MHGVLRIRFIMQKPHGGAEHQITVKKIQACKTALFFFRIQHLQI